jgi:hypothetical protein
VVVVNDEYMVMEEAYGLPMNVMVAHLVTKVGPVEVKKWSGNLRCEVHCWRFVSFA